MDIVDDSPEIIILFIYLGHIIYKTYAISPAWVPNIICNCKTRYKQNCRRNTRLNLTPTKI